MLRLKIDIFKPHYTKKHKTFLPRPQKWGCFCTKQGAERKRMGDLLLSFHKVLCPHSYPSPFKLLTFLDPRDALLTQRSKTSSPLLSRFFNYPRLVINQQRKSCRCLFCSMSPRCCGPESCGTVAGPSMWFSWRRTGKSAKARRGVLVGLRWRGKGRFDWVLC